jgi:hypothetical protein
MTESPDTQHLSRKGHNTRIALIRSGVEAMTTHGYISANIESILKKVGPKINFFTPTGYPTTNSFNIRSTFLRWQAIWPIAFSSNLVSLFIHSKPC